MVDLPLWKIWVRHLGWWHSQYFWRNMFHTTNQHELIVLPSGKLTVRPWKSPIFSGFTNLPTPMTTRVYVNLLKGNPMKGLVLGKTWTRVCQKAPWAEGTSHHVNQVNIHWFSRETNHQKAPCLMGKTMVSGVNFPSNQSNDYLKKNW